MKFIKKLAVLISLIRNRLIIGYNIAIIPYEILYLHRKKF